MLERLASQLGRPRGRFGRLLTQGLNRANRATNARAIELADVRPGDRALDIGFGGGVGLELLLATGAAKVTGVERSPDMVAAARRRFGSRVDLVEADVDRLPLPDAAFDRIVSCHTLYFWPDAEAGVRELRRVLAAGGRLVLALGRREDMEGRRIHRHGFTLYAAEDLRALLGRAFDDVDVHEEGRVLFGVAGTTP